MSYAHLTQAQRYQIEAFREAKVTPSHIAQRLGVHRSTIYRELSRGCSGSQDYRAQPAQEAAQRRARRCAANHPTKPPALWRLVASLIRQDWSPEQIVIRFDLLTEYRVSVPAIYAFVCRQGKGLRQHLRFGKRTRPWRVQHHSAPSHNKRSICERGVEVMQRTHLGHWEGDTLVGSPSNAHRILTLVERKSRYTHLRHIKGTRPAREVATLTSRALAKHKPKSITFDNGSENAGYWRIESKLTCPVYFADPHCPWQRGTCENTIGLVRQYIHKGTSGAQLSTKQLQRIADKLNHRPRKCLGGKTPFEVLYGITPVALRT